MAGSGLPMTDVDFLICDSERPGPADRRQRTWLGKSLSAAGGDHGRRRCCTTRTTTRRAAPWTASVRAEASIAVGVPHDTTEQRRCAGPGAGRHRTARQLMEMWRSFMGHVLHARAIVLLHRLCAPAPVTSMQPDHSPLQEMARGHPAPMPAGNFDVRVQAYERRRRDRRAGRAPSTPWQTPCRRRSGSAGTFIANVSHELKTPMTTIAGYTDGILDGTIPPEKERQYLQIISDESRRLSRLVRRMLDISQIQTQEIASKEDFDLCESMRRVACIVHGAEDHRPGAGRGCGDPGGPVMVRGDQDLITQVIYNLLENAAKFAAPGSTLYLGLAVNGRARPTVTVRNQGRDHPRRGDPPAVRAVPQGGQVPQRGQGRLWAWGCISSRPFWTSTRSRSPSPVKTASPPSAFTVQMARLSRDTERKHRMQDENREKLTGGSDSGGRTAGTCRRREGREVVRLLRAAPPHARRSVRPRPPAARRKRRAERDVVGIFLIGMAC